MKGSVKRGILAIFCASALILPSCATPEKPRKREAAQAQDAGEAAVGAREPAQAQEPLRDVTEEPREKPLLRLAVISDMNGRYGSDQYDAEVVKGIDMIIEDHPDIVINVGDMVAGQKARLNYERMWAGFHRAVTDRFREAGIPMAQVVGNHDGSAYARYANEREIYAQQWLAHKPDLDYVDDGHYPFYYSFRLKGVFFVALDVSTLDALSQDQYDWLQGQLAHNPTPYGAVVVFHVPLFPITTIKPTEVCRDGRLADLFSEYGVQLVINGHQQAYFPARYRGVTYVHAGALGGGPRPVRQNDGVAPKTLTFVNLYADHAPYIDTHLVNGARGEHFNHNLLPTYIVFGNEILPRVDIPMEDARFAHEYMITPHMTKSQMQALIEALREHGGNWGRIPDWGGASSASGTDASESGTDASEGIGILPDNAAGGDDDP